MLKEEAAEEENKMNLGSKRNTVSKDEKVG